MSIPKLLSALPTDLNIVLADVGSAGGLHERWRPIRKHVSALLFDPLEASAGPAQDRTFPFALGDRAGASPLFVLKRVSMTSTLRPNAERLRWFKDKPDHIEIVETLEVPTRPLDDVATEAGLVIDAIKIDVQGGELAVLKGASRCLSSSVFFAEIEVSFLDRYVGLAPFDEVAALMRGHGFDLLDLGRLKRYRYRNAAGIAVEGSSGKLPLGKLAFCDAFFILRDDLLLDRIAAAPGPGRRHLLLKAIAVLLTYGKADAAAWLLDEQGEAIEPELRARLVKGFRRLGTAYSLANLRKRVKRRLRGIS